MAQWQMCCGVVVGLCITTACLVQPDRPLRAAPDETVESLRVVDAAAAYWPLNAVARSPTFELTFDREPARAKLRLWLVRGAAGPDTLEDLADPPLRAATQRLVIPLNIEANGALVTARPETALSAGGRYELVWTRGEEPVERFRVRVSTSPAAGSALVQSWPGDRDVRVPPNVERALLRFDGYVHGAHAAEIALTDEHGHVLATTLSVMACTDLALPAGDCLALSFDEPLEKARAYKLTLGEGLFDATGAPLEPRAITFTTSSADDHKPPALMPIQCGLDELVHELGCILPRERGAVFRGLTDEPALVTLTAGTQRTATLALSGAFALALQGLPPGGSVDATLELEDLAGLSTRHTLPLASALGLATVRIDELRPDPLGPEPAQEYVELFNFGSHPVNIMGFSLTDDVFASGRSITTPLSLEPGERVLVVSPGFDPNDTSDGPLPSGVRLARLDGALSLRNDGEALYLRDELGRRIHETPRVTPTSAGQCLGLVGSPDEALTLVPDPEGGCTPGTATFDPWRATSREGAP